MTVGRSFRQANDGRRRRPCRLRPVPLLTGQIGNDAPEEDDAPVSTDTGGSTGGGVIVIPIPPQPVPILVDYLLVKITGNAGNHGKKLKATIYNDDGATGKPLSKVAVGEEVTITAPDLDGNVQLTFTIPRYLPVGTWYIGVHTDGVVEFYGSDGVSIAAADLYANGTADSFGTNVQKDKKLRVTAHYTQAVRRPHLWDSASLKHDSAAIRWDQVG